MKLCLHVNTAVICIIRQLNYVGMLVAQSKYPKPSLVQEKEPREGDTNGRLASLTDIHSTGNLKMERGGLTK